MGLSTIVMATSTFGQAYSQIQQGYAEKAQAKYNAETYINKAKQIDVQKNIDYAKYEQTKSDYYSKSISNISKSGIMPNGSSLAVILETQRRIGIDQAISQFNLQNERNYTIAQANDEVRQGRQAVYRGYSNAFSTIMKKAEDAAKYAMPMGK